jgi:DNA-binding transcriptional regulator YiaG
MGGFTMTVREFYRNGQSVVAKPYHYKMCGLDDVYLLNGFTPKETAYGSGVTVSDVDGLHRAIGFLLVKERKTLSPKELRFLRKEMSLTQAGLGLKIGQSDQQVARWEKGESEIPGPAERLIRILYVMTYVPAKKRAPLLNSLLRQLDMLTKADQTNTPRLLLVETNGAWRKAA